MKLEQCQFGDADSDEGQQPSDEHQIKWIAHLGSPFGHLPMKVPQSIALSFQRLHATVPTPPDLIQRWHGRK
jgi:hypothetical protein